MSAFFAYVFYFVAASASPLQRRWLSQVRNERDTGQIAFAFHISLITVILGCILPFISPFTLAGDVATLLTLSSVCGVCGGLFFALSYKAQKHVEAGVTSVVSNIYTPITILLASILLAESLTVTQIAGTTLLLVGIVLVSNKHRIGRLQFDRYFLMMLASGVFLGIALTAERALQLTTGFTAGTLFSWWAQCATLGLLMLYTRDSSPHTAYDTLVTGTLRFLQSLSWVVLVYVVGNVSVVSAVTTFKVVLIFIAGALFLHERDDLSRKILGSFVAVAGLLLMK